MKTVNPEHVRGTCPNCKSWTTNPCSFCGVARSPNSLGIHLAWKRESRCESATTGGRRCVLRAGHVCQCIGDFQEWLA